MARGGMTLAGAGKAMGYVLFFVLATIFFIVVTFPDDKVREFIEVKASNAMGAPLSIEGGGLTGLGTLDFSGIQIRLNPVAKPTKWPGQGPAVDAKGKKPKVQYRFIEGETLAVDASISSVLFGDAYEAAFEGEFMGGNLRKGLFSVNKATKLQTLTIGEIDGLLLGPERLLKGATAGEDSAGYDLRGSLSGNASVTWGAKPTDLRGDIDLVIAGAKIIKPTIPPSKQMPAPIELSDIELGQIAIKIKIDDITKIPGLGASGRRRGRRGAKAKAKDPKALPSPTRVEPVAIHFAEFASQSDEISVSFDPRSAIRIAPGKPFMQATMDLHMAIQVMPAYIDKKVTDKKTGAVDQPNKLLRMVMRDPKIRAATLNGVLGVKCVGPLNKIKCGLERPRRGTFKKVKPSFGKDAKDPKAGSGNKDTTSGQTPGTSGRKNVRTKPRMGATGTNRAAARKSAAERARERAEKRRADMEKRRADAASRKKNPITTAPRGRPVPPRPSTRVPVITPSPGEDPEPIKAPEPAEDGDEGKDEPGEEEEQEEEGDKKEPKKGEEEEGEQDEEGGEQE